MTERMLASPRESSLRPLCRYCLLALIILDGCTRGNFSPSFKSKPTTVKTSEHDTVLLPCYVDNLGVNSIRWWKDGTLIWDTSNTSVLVPANIRMFSNNTLEISDVSSSDTGEYICQVVRPEPWGPLNQVHDIEVQFPPTAKAVPETGELDVALNEEVTMGCTVSGVPKPAISWSFEGKEMQLLSSRATLKFTVTSKAMAGEYQCTATNGVGEPAVASILLKVIYRPDVKTDRMWIHTSPGLRAEISCIVNANPEARVDWYKDGKLVDDEPRIFAIQTNNKHKLIIRNVRASDMGLFTCKGSNAIGYGQQMIHLSGVANPATFKKSLRHVSEHNYTLIWEVDSYTPIIEYSLLFRPYESDSQPVEWTKLVIPADSYSHGPIHTQYYTLTSLKSASFYEASVLSRNRFGWSRPSTIFKFGTLGAELKKEEQELQGKEYDEDNDDIVNKDDEDSEDQETNINSDINDDNEANFIQTVVAVDSESYNSGGSLQNKAQIMTCSCLTVLSFISIEIMKRV